MSARGTQERRAPRVLTDQYRRLRTVHPIHVLLWLRNGVLLFVAAAASLYLLVAIQAGGDIAAASHTQQSLTDIQHASAAAAKAQNELNRVYVNEDVTLVGTGSGFVDQIAEVNKDLTLAAEGNAAGPAGTAQIQYVQNQLVSYLQLTETAVLDDSLGAPLGQAGMDYASGGEADVESAISNLAKTENSALGRQRIVWALAPGAFWWALLGPVIAMLLLVAVTAYVLARHFRRQLSPWLLGSLLLVTAAEVAAGFLNASDARNLSLDPWMSHPVTIALALLTFLAAAAMAYLAYHPRLSEYRFQPS
jgi:hypothetical protein